MNLKLGNGPKRKPTERLILSAAEKIYNLQLTPSNTPEISLNPSNTPEISLTPSNTLEISLTCLILNLSLSFHNQLTPIMTFC